MLDVFHDCQRLSRARLAPQNVLFDGFAMIRWTLTGQPLGKQIVIGTWEMRGHEVMSTVLAIDFSHAGIHLSGFRRNHANRLVDRATDFEQDQECQHSHDDQN